MNKIKLELDPKIVNEIEKIIETIPIYKNIEEFCNEAIRRYIFETISWIREGIQ